jgi:uncharacterized membrane protein YeiH
MAEVGIVRRVIVPMFFLGLTAAGLYNTYGDATAVQNLAALTACGGGTMCDLRMTQFSRSPFSHEYSYQLVNGGASVVVKCARKFVFVGDYTCEKH